MSAFPDFSTLGFDAKLPTPAAPVADPWLTPEA